MNCIETRIGKIRITTNGKKYRVERGEFFKDLKGKRSIKWAPITSQISLSEAKKYIEKQQEVWIPVNL